MKIKPANTAVSEADMTPMIDMTFQLIAFLMVLVNFTAEDVRDVSLPESELARPPERVTTENKIVIQLNKEGQILYGADDTVSPEGLKTLLSNERYLLKSQELDPSDATIIIRADRNCPTGKVQEVIKISQGEKFDSFILRAKEKGDLGTSQ